MVSSRVSMVRDRSVAMDAEAKAVSADEAIQQLRQSLQWEAPEAELQRQAQRARREVAAYRLEVDALPRSDAIDHRERLRELERALRAALSEESTARTHREVAAVQTRDLGEFADAGALPAEASLEQVQKTADAFQDASAASLKRTQKVVLETEQMATATLVKMNEQDEQLDRIQEEVVGTKSNLKKSKKLVRKIAAGAWNLQALWAGNDERENSRSRSSSRSGAREQGSACNSFGLAKKRLSDQIISLRSELRTRGASSETAARFDALERSFSELQALQRQTTGRREDVQKGYQDVRSLRHDLDDLRRQAVTAGATATGPVLARPTTGSRASVASATRTPSFGSSREQQQMDAEEVQALEKMRNRDAELDKQLEQIGFAVERVGEAAQQIGSTAQRQRIKADSLCDDCENAGSDVKRLNGQVRELLR